jgi:biopolymer transport protein TolR
MAGNKKKKHKSGEAFDINVTPMVDMFSVLISFLLVTAVFSATGQARVDVPFLSSRAPEDNEDQKEKKDPPADLNLRVENQTVELLVTPGKPGSETQKFEYQLVEAGLDELQGKVYEIRKEDLRVDKVTLLTDESVSYEQLVDVIDALRVIKPHREPLVLPEGYVVPRGVSQEDLIHKIVLGNVIL